MIILTLYMLGIVKGEHIRFGRSLNDWEIEDVASFFHLLHDKSPTREEVDKVRWDLKKNGVFDIRSYYHAIRGNVDIVFPWKGI
jgi:hypothetical protein